MDLTAISELSPRTRRLLTLASLIAIPTYVLPVGFWGLRALRPRILREAISGAIVLGALSFVVRGVRHFTSERTAVSSARPPEGQRWKLPIQGQILPEEMMGSAASGH